MIILKLASNGRSDNLTFVNIICCIIGLDLCRVTSLTFMACDKTFVVHLCVCPSVITNNTDAPLLVVRMWIEKGMLKSF